MIICEFEATLFLPPLPRGMFNKKKPSTTFLALGKEENKYSAFKGLQIKTIIISRDSVKLA